MARGTKGISPVPRPGWRCQPSHTQHGHTTVLLLNRFPQNGILTRGPLPLKRTSQHALAIAVSGQDIFFSPSCTAQVGPSDPTYTVDRIAPRLGDYSVECIQSASHNFQPHEYPTEHRAQTLTLPRSSARAAGVTSPEGRRTVPRSEGASKGAPSFGTARLGPAKTS